MVPEHLPVSQFRSSSWAKPSSSVRIESRERPSDGMPRMTSWVCAYGYELLMKCLADREEGRVRGRELNLAHGVPRVTCRIWIVTIRRERGASTSARGAQCHRARRAELRIGER